MNREIIFRGKSDRGEWIEGYFCPCCFGRFPCDPAIIGKDEMDEGCWRPVRVDPETVGQYTGLTDKNGKRIFEGDIVNGLFLFERPVQAVVTFQDGAFGLRWSRGSVIEFSAFTSVCNVEYEVIGNSHDSPELLN